MADQTTPNLFPPGVYNLDICYLADKVARYAGEVQLSVSSNLAATNVFDFERLTTYLGDIDKAVEYVLNQPQLDLPESHPMLHPIQPFPAMRDMINDLLDEQADVLNWRELGDAWPGRRKALPVPDVIEDPAPAVVEEPATFEAMIGGALYRVTIERVVA